MAESKHDTPSMMDREAELLPCPHEHEQRALGLTVVATAEGNAPRWYVRCLDCAATGPRTGMRTTAVEAWNRRAPSTDASASDGWRDIATARKVVYETVLLRIEHINYAIATGDDKLRWEEVVTGYWTDFNTGGWIWDGLAGTATHWCPVPSFRFTPHGGPKP